MEMTELLPNMEMTELLPNMEMTKFISCLKRLIARRGRPVKIYSDNGGTLVGAAKWMKTVMEDERVNNFLAHQGIQWQFNLSRAGFLGGEDNLSEWWD